MTRYILLATAALAALAITPSAHAAKRSCTSGGAKTVVLEGNVSVVSVAPPKKSSRPTRVFGCWVPTGRRFLLVENSGMQDDTFEIVGGRYIGMSNNEYAGVETHFQASSWDARKHVQMHDTGPCNGTPEDPDEDETTYGPSTVLFLDGGGIAYTCPD